MNMKNGLASSSSAVVLFWTAMTSVGAFTPPSQNPARTGSTTSTTTSLAETKADLKTLATELNPLVNYYDPLNLADGEFWGQSNEASIGFLRHAEIKYVVGL